MTTALIAAPLVTPGSGTAPLAARSIDSLPGYALPIETPAALLRMTWSTDLAPAAVPRIAERASAGEVIAAAPLPRRRVRSTPLVSRAVNQIALNEISVAPAAVTVAASAAREIPKKTLSRRLTGWLIGSGTPAVRPFPLVPAGTP